MLGHEYIACNHESIPSAHRLKLTLENLVSRIPRQQRHPSIATEGEKVEYAAFLVANKPLRHGRRILQRIRRCYRSEGPRGEVCALPPFRKERGRMGHPPSVARKGWATRPPIFIGCSHFSRQMGHRPPSGAKPSQCRASVMPRPVVRITSFFSVPAGGNEVYRSLKVVCQLNILPSFELNVELKENWYWPVWLMSG